MIPKLIINNNFKVSEQDRYKNELRKKTDEILQKLDALKNEVEDLKNMI